MDRLTVRLPDKEYDIFIERGLLGQTGEWVRRVTFGRRIAVVSDSNVGPLYAKTVYSSLAAAGFAVKLITIPAGEKSKTLSMLEYLYDEFMEFELTRTDAVLALGGGVVGDLAGFAAATILRGVDFIQIPTTLLAQVDSSVGGKTAVDLKAGKNLAGAFYQPKLVLIDPDCLDTLSDRDFAGGMAEVIKYGAIRDGALFRRLEDYENKAALLSEIGDIICRCCDIKREIVERDERDTGERMLLNFGHTFGHAYEKAYDYETFTHGEAVAAGMCKMGEQGEQIGMTEAGSALRLRNIVEKYKLPQEIQCTKEQYGSALSLDKKGDGETISLILLKSIGHAVIYKTTKRALMSMLERGVTE